MEKLLHERLRKVVESGCYLFSLGKTIGLSRDSAQALADEIEKYYIPRPRFEDGEPIGLYNAPYSVEYIAYFIDGAGYCLIDRDIDDDYDFQAIEEPVKSQQPKVYDADGVEINVGDTVYEVKTGYESKVTSTTMIDGDGNTIECADGCTGRLHYKPEELTHKEPVLDADGVEIKVGDTVWYVATGNKHIVEELLDYGGIYIDKSSLTWDGKLFTHKEPDSLLKLLDDMYSCLSLTDNGAVRKWADRLSAIIERGA